MAVLKPADAITVRGDPERTIRRFHHPYDTSGTGDMLKSTVLKAGHPGATRADPQVSRMILQNCADGCAAGGRVDKYRRSAVSQPPQFSMAESDPDGSVALFKKCAHAALRGSVQKSPLDLAVYEMVQSTVHACPNAPIVCFHHIPGRACGQTLSHTETVEFAIPQLHQAISEQTDPQAPLRVFQ